MKYTLIILLTFTTLSHGTLANPIDKLKLVGQGSMYWFLWELYEAKLYTASGQYQNGDAPLALAIRYNKTIKKEHLIQATQEQWQQQGISWRSEWLDQLESIWPSVTPGDEIIFKVDESGSGHFHFNGKAIGTINDMTFSENFLAIWLSQNTSEPKLRKQLIGKSGTKNDT